MRPDRSHLRGVRSHWRRRAAGRPAHARGARLPSALRAHRRSRCRTRAASSISSRWRRIWSRARRAALLADTQVAAFKLGVLGSAENARAVARDRGRARRAFRWCSIRCSPPAAATALAGDEVLRRAARSPGAARHRGDAQHPGGGSALGGAQRLLDLGCRYVLVTGTHDADARGDQPALRRGGLVREDRWQRLPGSYHGSGCTLASALAAGLAHGRRCPMRCARRRSSPGSTLARRFAPAAGQALPNRFFRMMRGLYAITPDLAELAPLAAQGRAGAEGRRRAAAIPATRSSRRTSACCRRASSRRSPAATACP